MITAVYCVFSPHFYLAVNQFGVCKNKLTSVFYASVLLLMITCCGNHSPAACDLCSSQGASVTKKSH